MKVATIIVNYNDVEDTIRFVNEITKYDVINRIVVVDNMSTTIGAFENLKKLESQKVKVLQADKNGGYDYGNNFGIKYLQSQNEEYDYIIISNPDIEVEEKEKPIARKVEPKPKRNEKKAESDQVVKEEVVEPISEKVPDVPSYSDKEILKQDNSIQYFEEEDFVEEDELFFDDNISDEPRDYVSLKPEGSEVEANFESNSAETASEDDTAKKDDTEASEDEEEVPTIEI